MSNVTQAMIPKARGMYAKRLSEAEYAEMMRRRSVPEVAAILRRHPYFERSLASLAGDPHRGQIEELLDKDIYRKYTELIRYDFGDDSFSAYYTDESELEMLLRHVYRFSIGVGGRRIGVQQYMVGHTYTDLYALDEATSLKQVMEAARRGHSPYLRVLGEHLVKDPQLRDFPLVEAEMYTAYYRLLFARIDQSFAGQERETVRHLFLQKIEGYNVQLIFRIKSYFSGVYDEKGIRALLLPFRCRIARYQMDTLIRAANPDTFIQYYRQLPFVPARISGRPEEFAVAGAQVLFNLAQQMLRMSPSPFAVLAAFVVLAKLQKENVVNIVEGVRYGMKPEEINALLNK